MVLTMPDEDALMDLLVLVGTVASNGSADGCVVDKIEQFAAQLANPATDPEEQIVALKFLLHFVSDLHQPLHSSDDHDRGGNAIKVSANGFKARFRPVAAGTRMPVDAAAARL